MNEILEVPGGGDEAVIDIHHRAFLTALVDGLLQLRFIGNARERGIEFEFLAGFHIDKLRDALKGKLQFRRVEDLQEDDVMHLFAEMRDGPEDGFGVVKQIGHDDDQPSPERPLRQGVKRAPGVGVACGAVLGEALQDQPKMTHAAACGDFLAQCVVINGEPQRVLLFADDVTDGSSDAAGVGVFGEPVAGTVSHRARAVDDDVNAQVGLLLKLLDIVALRAPENFPVEVAQIVALDVLAVVGKLDARPLERAGMGARAESLDDVARAEHKRFELAHGFGSEEIGDAGHGQKVTAKS